VWAPAASRVAVVLDGGDDLVLERDDQVAGTWVGTAPGVGHGDRYRIRLDGGEPLADPASAWQPDGVFGPSAVLDPARFEWHDEGWHGIPLDATVLYELHVGTFTPAGTLDAAIGELDRLCGLGVTTVELMPLNAFSGARNWGYDGVFWSAVQHTYGGPEALARFVDAAHARGLAVVLDVVYNHVGPEGSVHERFAPYFTDTVHTPWGAAINVADRGSDLVRRTILESACRWISDFHVDGLRVDAVHAIFDPTARPFLAELTTAVRTAGEDAGRTVLVIAESSANDPRLVRPVEAGGLGFDAVWNDDVHHALRVALTGERRSYYEDYAGAPDLAHALADRWVFDGRYSAARGRTHGAPALDVPPERLVVFTTNHDQIGNTPDGARPTHDVRGHLLAAATILLSPFTPMLFMGEEYGDPAPFPFFVDHADPELLEATRQGRAREFRDAWSEDVLDPADPATFAAAVLHPELADTEPHRTILAAYTELLGLRRRVGVLRGPADQRVTQHGDAIVVDRRRGDERALVVLSLGAAATVLDVDAAGLTIAYDSAAPAWGGDAPASVLDDARLAVGPHAVVLLATPLP
jgi:maltooligosyltrehalose trehalohydrolase